MCLINSLLFKCACSPHNTFLIHTCILIYALSIHSSPTSRFALSLSFSHHSHDVLFTIHHFFVHSTIHSPFTHLSYFSRTLSSFLMTQQHTLVHNLFPQLTHCSLDYFVLHKQPLSQHSLTNIIFTLTISHFLITPTTPSHSFFLLYNTLTHNTHVFSYTHTSHLTLTLTAHCTTHSFS